MPNPIEAQIKDRIQSFVTELDLLVRRSTLDSLRSVLEGGAAPAGRGRPAGSGRGPGRPKGAARGGSADEAAARIVAHVKANDGQGIGAIADAAGVPLKTAKKAAIALLASGALKKSGQKRGTVYHVGSGKKPRAKAGKRVARKAKRAAKPKRKATKKPAPKKAFVIPARKRLAPSTRPVAPLPKAPTDVPQALAV